VLRSNLVRILAITVAGLVTLAPLGARADQRQDLQSKGEQLAKEGRFVDAIESFKAADKIQQRASHACLIALAYTRRELWSQAQLWLSTRFARQTSTDPLPDWAPLAEKQIQERLATANVVEVTIDVKPAGTKAKITVSSFAPDEDFEPRKIHLPPGTHVVFARAEGYNDKQQTLTLSDKKPQKVVFDFTDGAQSKPPDGGNVIAPPVDTARPPPSNAASTALIVGGGAAIVGGVLAHVLMARVGKQLADAPDMATYDMLDDGRFEFRRNLAVGLYVVGAGLAVTGILIRKKHNPEAATVSAVPLPEGGGFVSVGWSR
jgi:hypothetical protein